MSTFPLKRLKLDFIILAIQNARLSLHYLAPSFGDDKDRQMSNDILNSKEHAV